MNSARLSSWIAFTIAIVSTVGMAQADTSINVPDGSFEQAVVGNGYGDPTSGSYPNLSIVRGGYTQNPSNFSIQSTNTSQAITQPGPGPAAQDGSNFLSMWPGETTYYDNNQGISTVIGSTLTVTTTGITDKVVAGRSYTAKVAITLPGYSWSTAQPSSYFSLGTGVNVSPAYMISLLVNGNTVASQTLDKNSISAVNVWQDLSTTWTSTANYDGQSLQVSVEAYDFTQGQYHAYTPQAAMDNIRLSYSTSSVPEPATMSLLAVVAFGFLSRSRRSRPRGSAKGSL